MINFLDLKKIRLKISSDFKIVQILKKFKIENFKLKTKVVKKKQSNFTWPNRSSPKDVPNRNLMGRAHFSLFQAAWARRAASDI
jgi:hypothetical protein